MEKSECKRMALWWLHILRGPTIIYVDAIASIQKYLKAGDLCLADIGTTEAELEENRVRGCKTLALHWLEKLRDGTITYKTTITSLCNTLFEGSLHPEDIGSSDREIESFACVSTEEFDRRLKKRSPYNFAQDSLNNPRG